MKLGNVFIAGVTALSFSAIAFADNKAKQESQAQPPAQSSAPSQSQSGTASQGGSTSQPQAQSDKPAKHAKAQSAQNPEQIKQAQQKLNVEADGKLGPTTQAALKDFQKSKGLQVSGQLDQETVAALGIGEGGSAATGGSAASGSATTGSTTGSSSTGSSSTAEPKSESKPAEAPTSGSSPAAPSATQKQ